MISAKEEPDRPIPPAVEGLLRVHKQVVSVDRDPAENASGAGRPGLTRLLVADTQAGSLIGKQGSTIKTFQDATGCNIRVLGSGAFKGIVNYIRRLCFNTFSFSKCIFWWYFLFVISGISQLALIPHCYMLLIIWYH